MGYNPDVCFTGRAPLEAANLGIDLADDEIAFRCNLVTIVDGKMGITAPGTSHAEAAILINAVNEQMGENDVRFYAGQSYRHLMVMKAARSRISSKSNACLRMTSSDRRSKGICLRVPAQVLLKLMEKSAKILADHPVNKVRVDLRENPANRIWLWGQGPVRGCRCSRINSASMVLSFRRSIWSTASAVSPDLR